MTKSVNINIVLLGPPGAGKGTQAELLNREYGLVHISTGDLLRESVKEGSETGRKIAEYMENGDLVPDEIVTKSLIERMQKPDAREGVMLDGYPRNKAQAESLEQALSASGKKVDLVLYFKTSEEVAVDRLSGRRVCPGCKKNYHVTNMPPKNDMICDKCGVELIQRKDDNPETVKKRFNVYQDRTKDLVEHYSDKNILCEMDGDLSAEELFDRISDLFKDKGLVDDASTG